MKKNINILFVVFVLMFSLSSMSFAIGLDDSEQLSIDDEFTLYNDLLSAVIKEFPTPITPLKGDSQILNSYKGKIKKIVNDVNSLNVETYFGYDKNGNLKSVISPNGDILFTIDYDKRNRATKSISYDKTQSVFNYDLNSRLSASNEQVCDLVKNGNCHNYTSSMNYSISGNITDLTSDVLPGYSQKKYYDLDNRLKAVKDVHADTGWSYEYNALNQILRKNYCKLSQDGDCDVVVFEGWSHEFDKSGRLTKTISPNQNAYIENVYDGLGRVIEKKLYMDAEAPITTYYTYNDKDQLLEERVVAEVEKKRVSYEYDKRGRIIQSIDYCLLGGVANQEDQRNRITSIQYSDYGRVVDTVVVENGETSQSTKTYDMLGRIKSYEKDGLGSIEYVYDDAGKLIETRNKISGLVEKYSYDAYGVSRVDYSDNTSYEIRHDSHGNIIQKKTPMGRVIKKSYNDLGLIDNISLLSDPTRTVDFSYYDNGQPESVNDAKGNLSKKIEYYGENSFLYSLMSSVSEGGIKTNLSSYDSEGNVLVSSNNDGKTFNYTYDSLGNLVQTTVTNGNETITFQYEYGVLGELVSVKRSDNNSEINYDYDSYGRTARESMHYDGMVFSSNTEYGLYGEKKITYPSGGEVLKTRTSDGRLSNVSYKVNGLDHAALEAEYKYFKYYPAFIESIDYANGNSSNFNINSTGQVLSIKHHRGFTEGITDGGKTALVPDNIFQEHDYRYNADQLVIASKKSFGINTNKLLKDSINGYIYNAASYLTGVIDLKSIDEVANNTLDFNAIFNIYKKQTDEERNFGTYFSYDTAGNRAAKSQNSQISRYKVDKYNRIESIETEGLNNDGVLALEPIVETYVYDDDGNIIEADNGRFEYTYNLLGFLKRINDTEKNISVLYDYDPLNRLVRRIEKKNDATVSRIYYVWHGNNIIEVRKFSVSKPDAVATNTGIWNIINQNITNNELLLNSDNFYAEELVDGSVENVPLPDLMEVVDFIYAEGTDKVIGSWKSNGDIAYYHRDVNNSVSCETDNLGKVTRYYNYTPFGAVTALTSDGKDLSLGTSDVVRSFASQLYEPVSEMHYLRNRFYSPEIGRFISQDPVGISGGINLYSYAGNNPITYSDIFGLSPEKSCVGTGCSQALDAFYAAQDFVKWWGGNYFQGLSDPNPITGIARSIKYGGGAGAGGWWSYQLMHLQGLILDDVFSIKFGGIGRELEKVISWEMPALIPTIGSIEAQAAMSGASSAQAYLMHYGAKARGAMAGFELYNWISGVSPMSQESRMAAALKSNVELGVFEQMAGRVVTPGSSLGSIELLRYEGSPTRARALARFRKAFQEGIVTHGSETVGRDISYGEQMGLSPRCPRFRGEPRGQWLEFTQYTHESRWVSPNGQIYENTDMVKRMMQDGRRYRMTFGKVWDPNNPISNPSGGIWSGVYGQGETSEAGVGFMGKTKPDWGLLWDVETGETWFFGK